MKCKICSTDNESCFSGTILNKYSIDYYYCSNCAFLQTESAYWLPEAYESPINLSDTGYMRRNLYYTKSLSIILFFLFGKQGTYLDYAGGYGVFVRMMRDIGFDFYWDDKYTVNLFSGGFEWDKSKKVDAITLFEVFEHFDDPIEEIKNLFKWSDTIFFSTTLYPSNHPKPNEWWYFGLEHGQHISLYSSKTLKFIAESFKVSYYNIGSLHVLTKRKVPTWILLSSKLAKVGLHKIIERFLASKTSSDFENIRKKLG